MTLPPFDADQLRAAEPQPPTPAALGPWRDRIDALDREILRLMNERLACAHEIGRIKKALALPVYVPAREEAVLQNVCAANTGPMTDASVRRLFERIIDETRSSERHEYGTLPNP